MRTVYIVICVAMLSYLLYQYLTGGPGNLTNLYASDGEVYKVLVFVEQYMKLLVNPCMQLILLG